VQTVEREEKETVDKKEEDILESTEAGLVPTQSVRGLEMVHSEKKKICD